MKHVWMIILAVTMLLVNALAEPAQTCPEVILAGNPTTGYSWTWTVEDAIVEADGGYVTAESADSLVGVGGEYRFLLRGILPGETVITFTYARPWETTAPLYTLTHHVRVDDALNVTILSTGFDW